MDLLPAFQAFIRVAETGSFSAVARESGASQPTVSRQIALLERHFDVRLFNRTTRSLTMTIDGGNLLVYARQVVETIETAEAALGRQRATARGSVRLGTPTAFGLFLTARLEPLLARHPGLSVELIMRDSFGDMIEEGLDLSVRVGLPAETSLITRHLAEIGRALVAAPGWLGRHASPHEPDDLLHLPCIAYTYGGLKEDWVFRRDGDERRLSASGPFRANNSESVHRAALSGLGVALLPLYQVQDDLAAGRLVRLLPDWSTPDLSLHAAYPGPRNLPVRTRTVLDFLVSLDTG